MSVDEFREGEIQDLDSAVPLPIPATSGEVSGSAPGQYCGITVRETSGSEPATVTIYDNANAGSGTILDEIQLAESASISLDYPRPGRAVVNGLYAHIAGAVAGSVFQ